MSKVFLSTILYPNLLTKTIKIESLSLNPTLQICTVFIFFIRYFAKTKLLSINSLQAVVRRQQTINSLVAFIFTPIL
jgi:hypothetical protein